MTQKKSSNLEDEVKVEQPEFEVRVEGEAVKEPPKQEEDVEALRTQLQELKDAQNLSKNRAMEAELQTKQAAAQLAAMQQSAQRSQYDSVVTALGAAQVEVDAAKRDIALSGAGQDYEGLANAQERLATAKAYMVNLEQSKNAYEYQGRQPAPSNVDSNQNLTYEERNWVQAHPEAMSDPRKFAKLNNAYFEAIDQGLQRGTKPYFDYIEEQLGYRDAPKVEKQARQEESPVMVAAPPSRSSYSGTGTGGDGKRFTMTKEEAEIAKLSGITPQEYVIQREKYRDLRRASPDDYPVR